MQQFVFFFFFIFILCVWYFAECIAVYHVHARYPQGSKEGIKQTPGTELQMVVNYQVCVGDCTWVPRKSNKHSQAQSQGSGPLCFTLPLPAAVQKKTRHTVSLVYSTVTTTSVGSLSQPNHVYSEHLQTVFMSLFPEQSSGKYLHGVQLSGVIYR